MPQATLASRYIFKLAANMASVPVYLLMEAILPRALGPGMYGNYSFATNLFQQLSGFLDMGTSTCFYNALARRQNETSLLSFYIRVALGVAALGLLVSLALLWRPLGRWVMPDVPLWLAPFAAIWAFLTWWGRVMRSTNDALGATIPSEIWRASISLVAVGLLALLFWGGWLNIESLFAQQYALLAATALAYWFVSRRHWLKENIKFSPALDKEQIKSYSREFFDYSHPLFVQALLSFVMLTAERWLLQCFDGSAQQGFFALSQKVSMACFLFVSAMTPLLMRELSIAWGNKNPAAMGALLSRFAPLLYVLAAYFSCFTLVEGRALVEIFGGSDFAQATLAVQIMALYPLHQAYGQMAGSVFHASGKTKILRNIAGLECVYGFAAAWFLLAPASLFGLNLGATGLAIKTVSVQFVTVNIYLFLASRFIPFAYWKNLGHQLAGLLVLLAVASGCRQCSLEIPLLNDHYLWRFIFSGLLYSLGVVMLCFAVPQILGLSRQDARELLVRFNRARFGKRQCGQLK